MTTKILSNTKVCLGYLIIVVKKERAAENVYVD